MSKLKKKKEIEINDTRLVTSMRQNGNPLLRESDMFDVSKVFTIAFLNRSQQ